jgi:hypothetical protein
MSRHSESLWRLERWRRKRETPVAEAGTEDINDYVSENGCRSCPIRRPDHLENLESPVQGLGHEQHDEGEPL